MKPFYASTALICWMCVATHLCLAQLPVPGDYLPHEYGQQFTFHHQLVDYFQLIGRSSKQVEVQTYGRTYEKRPLIYAVISSPANIARLEDIRQQHLVNAGLLEGEKTPASTPLCILWLSYGVHGNEASTSETAMAMLHKLTDPSNQRVQKWLENTVVILDPCLNPDGYDRYTHWYRSVADRIPNTDPEARERREPWPEGRTNHYLFDLNRDWAWQTQIESRQRLILYRQWMPHVHVDFHEMGHDEHYYFAPAAKPYHEIITDWQIEFQTLVGQNNARYFDREGWLYFTQEEYDLLYPSYGDTYPTFNGAVGMTYEQAGKAFAGRAVRLPNEDTLTLSDRIEHHLTTGLSTLEVSSREAKKLNERFNDYFVSGRNGAYLIRSDESGKRLTHLLDFLKLHGIQSYPAKARSSSTNVFSLLRKKQETMQIRQGDIVIPLDQAQHHLIDVFFEPAPQLSDSLTYDITAWSLPYAYQLDAYRLDSNPGKTTIPKPEESAEKSSPAYAYLIPFNSIDAGKLLSQLLSKQIVARTASRAFRKGNKTYPSGTLIILRADNPNWGVGLHRQIYSLAEQLNTDWTGLDSGWVDEGISLGSNQHRLLKAPRVLTIAGEGVNSSSYGEIWYYFEQVVQYPLTTISSDQFKKLKLDKYDLIVLPEGTYGDKLPTENLKKWIAEGGRLLVLGNASTLLAGKSGFGIKRAKKIPEPKSPATVAESLKNKLSANMPGAIFRYELDAGHPLSYGLGDHVYLIKNHKRVYEPLSGGNNVGMIGQVADVTGFAGSRVVEILPGSMGLGVHSSGKGEVVFMIDNPLFRSFWYSGLQLFSNAVFLEF